MLNQPFIDKLRDTLAVSEIHHQWMTFARNHLLTFFPLTLNNYEKLHPNKSVSWIS
jgi:hypothetical protein